MKAIAYIMQDGGVRIGHPTTAFVQALMGKGTQIPAAMAERQTKYFSRGRGRAAANRWTEALGKGGLTEDQALLEIGEKDKPEGTVRIELVELGTGWRKGAFSGALVWENGRLAFNMPTCRDIHRASMRAARMPKLAALDVEYTQADERGDIAAKQRIASQRQYFRDITKLPEIESATTVDELVKVWPDELE